MALQSEAERAAGAEGNPLAGQVRLMLQAAMLIFVYTIVVGILNGLDLVEFERRVLLAHLHGGTLGWMTLGILSATLFLFAPSSSPADERMVVAGRVLSFVAIAAIAVYVLTFGTTYGMIRPITGTITLLALVGFAAWAFMRAGSVPLSVPHLFVLVGLTTSVLGGVFGVLNGLAIALEWDWRESFFDAHPGTMEIGFVIPVAMGLGEWGIRRGAVGEAATTAGKIQVGLMFLAFAGLLFGILAEIDPLTGIAILPGVVGVVVFSVRMWPLARQISFLKRAPGRHSVMGGVLIGAAIVYITIAINAAGGEFEEMPQGQQLSFIHLLSVGGTTNALLAFVISLSRRTSDVLDDVIFWGLNVGVIGFVTTLTLEIDGLLHLFAPVMGGALLLAIAVHVLGLLPRGAGEVGERA